MPSAAFVHLLNNSLPSNTGRWLEKEKNRRPEAGGKTDRGYILSEDPTYITNHNQARTLIRKVDRDELLQILVRNYLAD